MSNINTVPRRDGWRRLERPYGPWVYVMVLLEIVLGLYLITNPSAVSTVVPIVGILVLIFFGYAACVMLLIPKMASASSGDSRTPVIDENHTVRVDELNESLKSLMTLFWRNVDECPALLKTPVHFRSIVDQLSQSLEKEVLSDEITTREEFLSKLERAETIMEYANIELANLIKQQPVPPGLEPAWDDQEAEVEDPKNNMSPHG